VLGIIFVNDNKEVNVRTPQISKCCSFCYNKPILNLNPITQARKGLIIYNTTNGISTLRKHVNLRLMHGWVDQFATKPKSLFSFKSGQNLEITTSLRYFTSISSIFFPSH